LITKPDNEYDYQPDDDVSKADDATSIRQRANELAKLFVFPRTRCLFHSEAIAMA